MFRSDLLIVVPMISFPETRICIAPSRKQGSEVLVGALPIGMSTCVSKPEPLPCTSMYYIEVHGSSSGLETHDVT